MTAVTVSSRAMLSIVPDDGHNAAPPRAYQTKTSFVAVHFDQRGQGRIVFLPCGAMLGVVGPSSCLPDGFEVMFDRQFYNVFEADLLERSMPVCEPIPSRAPAVTAWPRSEEHYGHLLQMRR